ncbi:hypothetical protein ROA7450_02311 [Roseovarius albus]|uniref:Nickel/cobalt homeostasis protein RcnB n=1 Tax=Roseovarius albus TaxID=1247867 RepID=A0A1X6ZDW6_9RHOB|nr:hypothetical protein [Roseovarius albus]SLN46879.1 hypothetical protein ROA7450_02311 [Roseovarius albus]
MQTSLIGFVAAIAMAFSPSFAVANNGKGKKKNHKNDGFEVQRVAPQGGSNYGHCPPGLAKKNIPCVPPGQAKKYYGVGEYLPGGYHRIKNPSKYGFRKNGYHVRLGDYVYTINEDTHEILNVIGAVADVLD